MISAPLPKNELNRIRLLHSLNILDTEAEQEFDDLVALIKSVCDVPIALVSLVDVDRQWFKACVGLAAKETPRDLAFCAHAILQPEELLVVEDALLDERFFDNPLVTGEPKIRFYAGAPLIYKTGLPLGTLCVIDRQPRKLSSEQKNNLLLVARQVMRIIELREAKERIHIQAQQFEVLSNSAPILVAQLDLELHFLFCNQKFKKWFGMDLDEVIGQRPRELFKHYSEEFLSAFDRCLGGEKVVLDLDIQNDRSINLAFIPIVKNSTIQGLFLLAIDISQVKQQQRALAAEQRNLEYVIEATQAGIWRWQVNTGEVFFNERWAEIVGYSLAELEPLTIDVWTQLVHPEDLAIAEKMLEKHFHGEVDYYDVKFRMRHKLGHWVWVHARGKVFSFCEDGKPEWMYGTHSDITETYETHLAIILSEQKLSTLYNLSPVAIALNSFETGEFIECNPEFYRLIGYSPDEFKGLTYWDITPKTYLKEEALQLASLRNFGRYGPYEKTYITKSGEKVSVLLNGVLIDGDNGEKYIWSIVQDITERKRIEKLKNEFVSAVSHELRTPLTSISGSLGLVVNGLLGPVSPNIKDMLAIAQRNCQRLSRLINDLLDMEKLAAGKMSFTIVTQPLLPILENSLEATKSYADEYKVRLTLVNANADLQVAIDADRFLQVMSNFLSNAIKFSPPNSLVEVRVEQEGETVRVSVVDQGKGIDEEFRARIFQKFSQADASSSRQQGGTGLGLSISKELIERMGGTIGYSSELGKGSRFFVELPLKQS